MGRKLPDGILKAYAKFTDETEIPTLFSLWVGISSISSCMGRDCFLDLGHFVVFPNTYIVLVAGSAKCRKSTSISCGRKFLEHVTPRIKMLSQKMTPEALIGALSGMTADGDSKIINEAEGVFIVDELATLIDRNAFKNGMIPILTKLYDCDDFPYETRGRGLESIKNPCLSILGGSTADWIKESVPMEAIGGGFTSRVIFVYKDTYEKLIPWPSINTEISALRDSILHDLCEIAKMRGKFTIDDKAKKLFTDEYKNFIDNSDLFHDKNLAGYAGRRHITLLKVAMCISASVSNKRVIEYADMRIAIDAMRMVENDMPHVLATISNEFVGTVGEEVLEFIKAHKRVKRSTLVKKMAYKLTSQQLNVILDTLMEYEGPRGNKIITMEQEGKRTMYVYTA